MAVQYLCKVCRGHLNVKTSIILAAAKLSNRSQRGLILLESGDRKLYNNHSSVISDQRRRGIYLYLSDLFCPAEQYEISAYGQDNNDR